jgi:ABC-type glycerol-3-phosphate transport system permease component
MGIILLYAAMQIPFSVFLIYGFIAKIPVDLDEAGIIDGCGPLRLFITIIFPLLKPAFATVIVLTFLNNWNDFMAPLIYLDNEKRYTLALGLQLFKGMYNAQWHLMMAASAVVLLPALIVFILGQKYFIEGIAQKNMVIRS